MKTAAERPLRRALAAGVLGAAMSMSAPPVLAVDDLGIFEMEGNAVDDSGAPAPDDWETLYTGGGSAFEFTGIVADSPDAMGNDASIFIGGRKDIQDIPPWGHKSGSSPDKDEITNAYAAAYNSAGDTIVYFGADRISNVGDAFMGFWFFKKPLIPLANGSFMGEHTFEDVLALVNFPQGANASPEISVVIWDTSCNKAASNNPAVGECAAKNLRLKFKDSAVCDGSGGLVCAITNDEDGPHDPTASPWPFQSKNDATPDQFPFESFYEGGINLTQLIGGDSCFSSFLAETRSSKSFTATLKDWVIGDFELCSVDVTKECGAGDINETETGFVFPYSGVAINDGSGTLYDVVVIDNNGTPGDDTDDTTHVIGTLTKDQQAEYSGEIASLLNPPTNTVTVLAASVPGGELTITDTATDECEAVNRNPMIGVSKDCEMEVIADGGKLVLQANFMGQVCNTTGGDSGLAPIGLVNVVVTDDSGTPGDSGDDQVFPIGALPADTCQPYGGSYLPASPAGVPGDLSFTDTVTATGQAVLGFGSVEETASATCPLCPPEE